MTSRSLGNLLFPLGFAVALLRCGSDLELPSEDRGDIPVGGAGQGGRSSSGGMIGVGLSDAGGADGDCMGLGCGGAGSEPLCGDSIQDAGEGCDDGNTKGGDGCTGQCRIEPNYDCPTPGELCVSTVVCGDSIVSGSEVCDDGNTTSADGCSQDCANEPGYSCFPGRPCTPDSSAECGNREVEHPEACDDGGLLDGDGCDATCKREDGYTCRTPGEPCVADVACGDGRLSTGEDCDDANSELGDGCDGVCQKEPFYVCLRPGQACVSTIACGDGEIVGDEACDDSNTTSGDGCSADCKTTEPGYTCPKTPGAAGGSLGGACTPTVGDSCGDGRLNPGEYCDDGNTTTTDGCTATCTLTPGYTCAAPGRACSRIEWCGDGKVTPGRGEQCDDGNDPPVGGDGCSAACIIEANFSCPSAGQACVSLVVCGDQRVTGGETCDDGNLVANDGCGATCAVETGWSCPAGGRCRADRCGDSVRVGNEQCDDGNAGGGDGCSATCQLELGYACSIARPNVCTATVCGNGQREGLEQCDDGNLRPFDTCSPTCTIEPGCIDPAGNRRACAPVCGDGLKFPEEACDDGNSRGGDGCSATCLREPGYICVEPAADPSEIVLPIVYRDFTAGPPPASTTGHVDFDWTYGSWNPSNGSFLNAAASSANRYNFDFFGVIGVPCTAPSCPMRLARASLGNSADVGGGIALLGKPVFAYAAGGCPLSATGTSGSWLRRNGVYNCASGVQSTASFSQWFADSAFSTTVSRELTLVRCPRPGAPTPDPICNLPGDPDTFLFDSQLLRPDGTSCVGSIDCDGFFPLDDQPQTKGDDCGAGSPNGQITPHNFFFSSEVRYWFEYRAAANATLTFTGDDDVFVFVNGRLVVDIGGIHDRQLRTVTLNAATQDLGTPSALLNLQEGRIYEIAVFQAERNRCASNYRLQLKNFVFKRTSCTPDCGDGIVTPDEACDDGRSNNVAPGPNTYGRCTTACERGPFCGDGVWDVTREGCDNGLNTDTYATSSAACAPGCLVPPSCGDGVIDGANGEQCDDGALNQNAYGRCSTSCRLGRRCGDGVITDSEQCDDSINNGTSGSSCSATCTSKCGNATLDAGEECDDGAANNTGAYGRCSRDCHLGARCGDGIKNASEQCDDGRNDGSYGKCAPGCVFGPRCGDGTLQAAAGEKCDGGSANRNPATAYGQTFCTTRCQPAPYCGDRSVDVGFGETCDDGLNSGQPGSCTADCSGWVPLPSCGDGIRNPGEECDAGTQNGVAGSGCDARCRVDCGNGVQDPGEECDDGRNDGSYGSCNPNCTLAGYCGDGVRTAPEECDLGDSNATNPYGIDTCTTTCQRAPFCGDGRIQVNFGEACDGGSLCDPSCQYVIPR